MDLIKLCIVALFGLFLLNPDVQYAAAVPAPASQDNGVSNFLQKINPLSPLNWQKAEGDITKHVGNIFDFLKGVIEAPVKGVFQQDKPQPAGYADTTAKKSPTAITTTTTTATPAPQDNRDILSRIIDSIKPFDQKIPSSPNNNFFGNMLDTLFKKQQPVQTTTTTTTTTTLAPQLNTEIGIAALMSNIRNLIDSIMSLMRSFLGKNQSFELGSIIQNVMKAVGSTKAISDIFLQKDMGGGLGQIGDEFKEIMSSIKNITDIMSKPEDFWRMLAIPGYSTTIIKNIRKLFDDLLSPLFNFGNGKSNLPSLNIPKKFVAALESVANICNLMLEMLFPPEHKEATNDIHSLANHTAGLVSSLSHIEDMLEKQFPKIKFLNPLVKLPKYAELLFANDTLDDKNILNVIEKIFPNITLTEITDDFGKLIKNYFPNIPAVQSVGDLLQNPLLVNILVNIIISNNLLQFGPLKDSMLQVTGNLGTRLLQMDRNGLIVKFVDLMEDYSTIFEHILQLFQDIVSQLKPDPKKGNPIGQVITNIPKTIMNPENGRMFLKIIYEINLHLPHNVLFRFIKGIFDNSFSLKSLKYLLTGGPVRDFIAFLWRILQRTINSFISILKYWLTGGPIRQFIEFIRGIIVHEKNH